LCLSSYSDGTSHLDTPFSRLLGKPPIIVAGMTPSTVGAGFASAALSAGYRIELAVGGHYNPAALCSKVAEIQANIPAGVGITLNALYINPVSSPSNSLSGKKCVVKPFPSKDFVSLPVFQRRRRPLGPLGLTTAGIKHISFRPGSAGGSLILLPPISTSLLFSSGRVDTHVVVTHVKTYTNQSSPLALPFAIK